jgi:hypothetical protein
MRTLTQHFAHWTARLRGVASKASRPARKGGTLAILLTLGCLLGAPLTGCYAHGYYGSGYGDGYGYGVRSGYYGGGYYRDRPYYRAAPPAVIVTPRYGYGYRGRGGYYRAPAARPRYYDRGYRHDRHRR